MAGPAVVATPGSAMPPTSSNLTGRALPPRPAAEHSFEDAYVAFILACNPSIPFDTPTEPLRIAFRDPPKSGGRAVSPFNLFELVCALDRKEIKTWGDLVLRMGVEPPDQEKGESSQKIQQYAVRLKRWLKSMHLDAFFAYMQGQEHPYWTQIPPAAPALAGSAGGGGATPQTAVVASAGLLDTPIAASPEERDGILAQDDMALRALLPQIRPRRGRKRHRDDGMVAESPLVASAAGENITPWSAHPDQRFFPPPATPIDGRAGPHPMGVGGGAAAGTAQTPLRAYPHSAITPATNRNFWADEPQSAITPIGGPSKRRGVKNVSSAWKTGGTAGSGKVRGRPPVNKQAEGPFSAFPTTSGNGSGVGGGLGGADSAGVGVGRGGRPAVSPLDTGAGLMASPSVMFPGASFVTTPTSAGGIGPSNTMLSSPLSAGAVPGRPPKPPTRPSRLSLQVPPRTGGNVRLATPPAPSQPPTVMINGEASPASGAVDANTPSSSHQNGTATSFAPGREPTEVHAILAHGLLTATWADGEPSAAAGGAAQRRGGGSCSVAEAFALAGQILEGMRAAAPSAEAFLASVATVATPSLLDGGYEVRVLDRGGAGKARRYEVAWKLRFAGVGGQMKVGASVDPASWKGPAAQAPLGLGLDDGGAEAGGDEDAEGEEDEEASGDDGGRTGHERDGEDLDGGRESGGGGADVWQRRYRELLKKSRRKEEALEEMRRDLVRVLMRPVL